MRFSLTCRLFVFAALAVPVLATPAFAAKAGEEKTKDAHAHPALYVKQGSSYVPANERQIEEAAHGEKGGLDFTAIKRWDLGIYTLVVFALLLAILSKFAWPAIKEGLEKREVNIRGALDEARKDREDAKAALVEAKKQLDAAATQVKAMLDEARRDADALKVTEREAGVKEAAAERERARRETEATKAVMMKEVYEQAVKLAALMSEKALGRQVTLEDHKRLLDDSISELKGSSKA